MSVDTVSLGDATASLTFSNPRFDESGYANLEVRLQAAGLDALLGFYAHDPEELVQYFRSLDEDWRGWTGERCFASIERDLVLRARHGRRIEISVTLTAEADRDVSIEARWSCTAVVSVEAGEQLSRFVRDIEDLARRSR
ncbi:MULTISPECIES: DUF6228 family protein [unclassified Microbacterium]|uniref:DUF6228 family protein n=1 Tax=unclassified Microbacterium TaxID=2609290 RepID=UPI003427088D